VVHDGSMHDAPIAAVHEPIRMIEDTSERAQATALIAAIRACDLDRATIIFDDLLGFADTRFKMAIWSLISTMMAPEPGSGAAAHR